MGKGGGDFCKRTRRRACGEMRPFRIPKSRLGGSRRRGGGGGGGLRGGGAGGGGGGGGGGHLEGAVGFFKRGEMEAHVGHDADNGGGEAAVEGGGGRSVHFGDAVDEAGIGLGSRLGKEGGG